MVIFKKFTWYPQNIASNLHQCNVFPRFHDKTEHERTELW